MDLPNVEENQLETLTNLDNGHWGERFQNPKAKLKQKRSFILSTLALQEFWIVILAYQYHQIQSTSHSSSVLLGLEKESCGRRIKSHLQKQ